MKSSGDEAAGRDIYIPIGNDCSIAHFLREKSMREEALPFDWNVTPIASAISLIGNGFNGFLDSESLLEMPPTGRQLFDESGSGLKISRELITPVFCKRYEMLFPHDFDAHGLNMLSVVKRKYEKRIDRFIEIMNCQGKVYFVSANNPLNEWQVRQYEACDYSFNNSNYPEWKNHLSTVMRNSYPEKNFECIEFDQLAQKHSSFREKIKSLVKKIL